MLIRTSTETTEPRSSTWWRHALRPRLSLLYVARYSFHSFQRAAQLKLLLAFGANTNHVFLGMTPLALAITSGNDEAVSILLKSGAGPFSLCS